MAVRLFGVAFSLLTEVVEACVEGCDEVVVSCVVTCDAGIEAAC